MWVYLERRSTLLRADDALFDGLREAVQETLAPEGATTRS
jgi:hypothetical protein